MGDLSIYFTTMHNSIESTKDQENTVRLQQ